MVPGAGTKSPGKDGGKDAGKNDASPSGSEKKPRVVKQEQPPKAKRKVPSPLVEVETKHNPILNVTPEKFRTLDI